MTFRDQTALHFSLNKPPHAVHRIAVFRALQLGDMLCAVPALRALRAGYPAAQIVLIGLPWAQAFSRRFCRYVDDFIPFPGHPALPEQAPRSDLAAFDEAMQARRFDLAIQMHGDGRVTNKIVARFGADRVVGFRPARSTVSRPGDFLRYENRGTETRRLLRLAVFSGGVSRGEALEFPVTDNERRDAFRIAEACLLKRGGYACLHVGARDESRCWSREGFARTAESLYENGIQVVMTGVHADRARVDAIRRAVRAPIIDLVGMTEMGTLAVLLSGARLLVCNDTGVSHLAAALGVRSIVIFTGSDWRRWAPMDRTRHTVLCQPSDAQVIAAIRAALAEEHADVA